MASGQRYNLRPRTPSQVPMSMFNGSSCGEADHEGPAVSSAGTHVKEGPTRRPSDPAGPRDGRAGTGGERHSIMPK